MSKAVSHARIFFTRRRGFTLVEVLVAVGVISVLVGLLIPVIGNVRESARRTVELSHLRQLTAACILYAQESDGLLPVGQMVNSTSNGSNSSRGRGPSSGTSGGPGPGSGGGGGSWGSTWGDDYTWINYRDAWKPLTDLVPELNKINSCLSVRDGYPYADDFGKPEPSVGYPDDAQVGWIYWGGRDDLIVNGKLAYRSMRRLGQHLTPGSQTLWTCWCWDSAGNPGPSICPHVGHKYISYPSGVTLAPPPDGLGISLDDGSASFVAWNDMIIITQANGWKLYYQP